MPPDARTRPVFSYENMFERFRLKASELRRTPSKRQQEVRQFAALFEPPTIEIIMPAEGHRAALPEKAVEFEFLEAQGRQYFHYYALFIR